MRVMKYYKRPDRPEVVRLDKVATKDFGCVKRGDMLVSYPLHLSEPMRLSMWVRSGEVHVDWVRELSDA